MIKLTLNVIELVAASFLCVLEEICTSCEQQFGQDESECLKCLDNLIHKADL